MVARISLSGIDLVTDYTTTTASVYSMFISLWLEFENIWRHSRDHLDMPSTLQLEPLEPPGEQSLFFFNFGGIGGFQDAIRLPARAPNFPRIL
jgi:hypothetical protein